MTNVSFVLAKQDSKKRPRGVLLKPIGGYTQFASYVLRLPMAK